MCSEWYVLPPLLFTPLYNYPFTELTNSPPYHYSCGVPIFSNTPITPCRNCSKPLTLSLNPRIIGTLLDETGSLSPSKLLWSARAWEQLFGRSVEEIAGMIIEDVRLFEQRVLWMRCHLVVGWSGEVERLGVLGVLM